MDAPAHLRADPQGGAAGERGASPVPLGPVKDGPPDGALLLALARAAAAAGDGPAALALAADLGPLTPLPGSGGTRRRWELLAGVGASDLTVARAVEAHLDAVAVLAEAGAPGERGAATWGVFAAEAPGTRLDARAGAGGAWRLTGTKPWCSLAASLTDALVTAHTGDGRRLFAVGLRGPGVVVHPATGWVSRGLAGVPSVPVDFDDVPATPVGRAGWYLERPGFAWGGMGVAACWYGGAVGVARRVRAELLDPPRGRAPDQVALMHLGAVDAALAGARGALASAAEDVDAGRAAGPAGAGLGARVRAVVAGAAEAVLARAAHALGPAPLAFEEEHARRVADLGVYLRQHHGERDLAALGGQVLDAAPGAGAW